MSNIELPVVLITGSSGFLGQAIARGLMARYRVIGLDSKAPKQTPDAPETLQIDLSSDDSVASAFAIIRRIGGQKIASVIHLAAYYDTTGEDNPLYDAVTVQGTRRILDALKTFETEQLIFSSTMLAHAPSRKQGVKINEDSPLAPGWAYPASKVDTEALIHQQRGDIKTVVMRFAGVYDEDCRAAFLAQQIARIFERLPTAYVFTGDINHGQPYVHRDDLIDAVVRAVDRRAALPEELTLLIGESRTPSYSQMQQRIGMLIHEAHWHTLVLPKGLVKMGSWVQNEVLDQDTDIETWMIDSSDDHYELDTSRARTLLGWSPQHGLMDTLPEIIRRLEIDPTDWYVTNKLDSSRVADSQPELDQAKKRLRSPLSRKLLAQVDAEIDQHRASTLWAPFLNASLGIWLIVSPFAYGLFDPVNAVIPPALGHELAAPGVRNAWLGISEMLSGALILVFSLAGIAKRRSWMQWIVASVGIFVMLAPLVFWTTNAAAYSVDTLIGMLVVAFAVIVPPTPGISRRALVSPDDRPLGWSYSPSTFSQRLPIVAVALTGLFVSRYLAAYQLGHIESLWDPFFGPGPSPTANGSEAVVTSWVSKGFPIADAGLGALTYALDILAGAVGDRRRWRTMPWMVFLFGLLIVPLGVTSVIFVIIQPPLIGALCTLCIFQTVVTLILVPYSIDEVLATCQYLIQAKRAGEPFWRTFWHGGPALSEHQLLAPDLDRPAMVVLRDFVAGGMTFPSTLIVSAALGVWLVCTSLIFGTQSQMYFSDHLFGCLVILIAFTAMAEMARPVRFLNVLIGVCVAASPFVLAGATLASTIGNVVVGLTLIALSLPRGKRSDEHYGSWDRFIV